MINVVYHLKTGPANKPALIQAYISLNKKREKLSTGKSITPTNWSKTKQQVLSVYKYSSEYNQHLKDFKESIERIGLEYEKKKARLDIYTLRELLEKEYKKETIQVSKGEVNDFISFIDNYIQKNKQFSKSYKSMLMQVRMNIILAFNLTGKNEIARYKEMNPKQKSANPLSVERILDFDTVNYQFVEAFKQYLLGATFVQNKNGIQHNIHYKSNYIAKQIKLLKQFIKLSQRAGYVKYFEAGDVKVKTEEVDNVFIDGDELKSIASLKPRADLSQDEVMVADLFVYNWFMGFRYSDLKRLLENDFTKRKILGEDELIYLGRNQKTDKKIEFVVHKSAVRILKKYNFKLPVIAETKFNELIKVICMKAGIDKMERIRETRGGVKSFTNYPKYSLVSSHTGRRSFCSNYYMAGVPIQSIMAVSGHVSEQEFRKYIGKEAVVSVEVVAEQMKKINPFG
jgi:hypothetical protein